MAPSLLMLMTEYEVPYGWVFLHLFNDSDIRIVHRHPPSSAKPLATMRPWAPMKVAD